MKVMLAGLGMLVWIGCTKAPDSEPDDPGAGSDEDDGQGNGSCYDLSPPSSATRLWSDPATWGGSLPGTNDDVVIPEGTTVVLDQSVAVNSITVRGTLMTPPGERFAKMAWTKLAQTAAAGSTTLLVYEDTRWNVGDRLAITPSGSVSQQFDEATVVAVAAHGDMYAITLDAPLAFTHEVISAPELDPDHPSGHITYASEVLNLTRSRSITAQQLSVVETGTVSLEDVEVVGTGIDWSMVDHGGQVHGVVVRDVVKNGPTGGGTGFIIEGGSHVLWEDAIVYNVTGDVGQGNSIVGFGWSPTNGRTPGYGVDHVYCVRCVAANLDSTGSSHAVGFLFSGMDMDPETEKPVGYGGAVASIAVGVHKGGTYSGGFRTQEHAVSGLQFLWKVEAHANRNGFFIDGNLMKVEEDGLPFNTGLMWRNRVYGLWMGAYSNDFRHHNYHFLGNLSANVGILNSAANWNRFVLDGEGVTPQGMKVVSYVAPPGRWSPYVRTTFRGHALDIDTTRNTPAANVFLEFPLSEPALPTHNFCATKTDEVFPQDRHKLVGEDEMRFGGVTFTASACPGTVAARELIAVPDVATDPTQSTVLHFAGSRYRYLASYTTLPEAKQLEWHIENLQDWTHVVEEPLEPCQ